MKKLSFKGIALALAMLTGGILAGYAQMPIGGTGGPGPVINAPGSPAGIGQPGSSGPPPGPGFNQPGAPAPAPGLGNGPAPAPGSGVYNPGPPVDNPPPPLANPGPPSPLAPMVVGPALDGPDWQNAGTITVVACGYDAQGVWRTLPLRVSYTYNGAQYSVTVDSAWNPWTDAWNFGVDVPAFSTYYFLNGNYYNFYVNLSTGTYYFNL